MKSKATILVSGMIAADPWQGGATWAVLQYVLGLQRLGHDVHFVEPIQLKALRPSGSALTTSENLDYFVRVCGEFALSERSALLLAGTRDTFGLSYERLKAIARRTDVLINISGMLTDEALVAPIPIRVYLDLDPAFNQLWHAVQGIDMRFAAHTHHVTIGQNLGDPDCPVPACGVGWLKTWHPVVLERWPVAGRIGHDALTTVANWRSYGSIEHKGVLYGQKALSFRQLLTLPTMTSEEFLLALAIHPAETRDLAALKENGWKLTDPAHTTNTPAKYHQFIQESKAEFGVAKNGYVVSHCGWFSDRSVCYLASGRPVIAQDTGFSRHLPAGEGLFSFRNRDEVLGAIEQLRADYPGQAAKARLLAIEHFDSDKVLRRFLELVGA